MAYKQSKGFSTVSASGQNDLVADEHKDTLTVTGGTGVTITTDAASDTLTITSPTELSDDTSPQLGGDLDVGGKSLTSSSNGDITLLPNGTGKVGINTASPAYSLDLITGAATAFRVKGATDGVDVNCTLENAGTDADDGTLLALSAQAAAGDPSLRFAIAGNETWSMGIDNSDGDKLKISQSSTLHTDTRLTLQGNKVGIGTAAPSTTLDVAGTFKVSGTTTLNTVEYTWPTSDGSSGQQLTTDASGGLSWAAAGSGVTALSGLTDTDISSTSAGHILVRDSGDDSFDNVAVSGDATMDAGGALTLATVAISKGGTGATSAAAARSSLGVDAAGTDNSTNVTLANTNYLSISGQEITGGTVPVGSGGTGATTLTDGGILLGSGTGAVTAMAVLGDGEMIVGDGTGDPVAESGATLRASIGCDAAGTDNSTNVTLASVSGNYLSLSGQEITAGTIPTSLGGTGATSVPMIGLVTAANAAAARSVLDVDDKGTDNSTDVTLANTNYLSISGQEITGGTIPVTSGGTGLTAVTSGHVLYASGSNTIASAAPGGTSGVQAYHSHLDKISSAGNGSDGQVLTSDGAGNIAWETVTGGSGGGSVDLLGSSTSAITAGDSAAITAAKTSNYTANTANVIIPVDTSSSEVTITLYAASGNAGRVLCVKDTGGNAYDKNITIDANGSETIDGAATQTIAGNYGSVSMFCNGSAWFII